MPRTIHGECKTKLYSVWTNLRFRCNCKNASNYKDYGGRGIKVCRKWDSFVIFRDWAYKNGYREGLQIDRKNNNGDYKPSNCHWTTGSVNSRNRRSRAELTAFGETKSLSEWLEDPRCVVNRDRLDSRVKAGWSPENVLTIPNQRTLTHLPKSPNRPSRKSRLTLCGIHTKIARISNDPTCEDCLAVKKGIE